METRYFKMDPNNPEPKLIALAARLILDGEVVAFPTDTVYGLGANALDDTAVNKIFAVKGRRPDNPLILLVENWEQACRYVKKVDDAVIELTRRFWPGPLTLVAWSAESVSKTVRAGLPSVGVRMPHNRITLELIRQAGVPLAAPSANLSGRPSPTTAEHVQADLDGRIAAIIDGGPTGLGIESTILDVTAKPYKILRPGGVSQEQLVQALPGCISPDSKQENGAPHYRPQCRIIPVADVGEIRKIVAEMPADKRWGIVVIGDCDMPDADMTIRIEGGLAEYGKILYQIFHSADEQGLDYLVMQLPPESDMGTAIADRIKQASLK